MSVITQYKFVQDEAINPWVCCEKTKFIFDLKSSRKVDRRLGVCLISSKCSQHHPDKTIILDGETNGIYHALTDSNESIK